MNGFKVNQLTCHYKSHLNVKTIDDIYGVEYLRYYRDNKGTLIYVPDGFNFDNFNSPNNVLVFDKELGPVIVHQSHPEFDKLTFPWKTVEDQTVTLLNVYD